MLPTRPGLADATPAEVRRDVELAVEAGLDVLRVQAHIADHELYRAADELGIAAAAGLPDAVGLRAADPAGGRAPGARGRQRPRAPSVDRPVVRPRRARARRPAGGVRGSGPGRLRRLVSQQLPTWNKSILDRWLKRAFEQADPTRPTVAHGGVLPHLPRLDGTDTHLWLGWHRGEVGELAELARVVPRPGPLRQRVRRPVGAGLPRTTSSTRPAGRRSTGIELARAPRPRGRRDAGHACHRQDHPTFDSWRTATQRNQAMILRHHIETLRRLKYRPSGWVLLLVAGRPVADDLGVGPRRRATAEAGVADRRRRLPAGRRDHRSAAGGRGPR